MFLAQSFKKFLKDNFQEPKNAKNEESDFFHNDNIFQLSEDMSNDPSLAFLTGNSYHHTPINHFWKKD